MVATGYAFRSKTADTATTATASLDTLASVTGRGASATKELTLSGGAKAGAISPLSSGGSVNVAGVYMIGGGIKLPAISTPTDPSSRIYQTNGTLYYGGTPVMMKRGSAYVLVQTSDDPVANGASLLATYTGAKSLKPHGQDLATSNRLTVLIPPGRYDITASQLVLDAEFIDLVGLSTARADQYISGTNTSFQGTLVRQTANDVRIENLFIECSSSVYQSWPPSAYRPDTDTTDTVIRNCEFLGKYYAISMGIHANFAGHYEDIAAGDYSFGYMGDATGKFINCKGGKSSFGYANKASGTFVDCVGGNFSFGYYGSLSGTFVRCTGGQYSFGYKATVSGVFTDCAGGNDSFGREGTASGTFDRCTSGYFGFGYKGTASGTFTNCTASNTSFGAYGTASGTFERCTSGLYSFGYRGTANGTFTNCKAGDSSFGTYGTAGGNFFNCTGTGFCFGFAGTASGVFTGCKSGDYSFGTGDYSTAAIASGTFTNCVGGNNCFGASGGGSTITTVTGTFVNCTGGGHSFGGQYATNTGMKIKDCSMTSDTWWGSWSGRMENCRWGTGFNCLATARIYGSTIVGTLNLDHYAAGVTQCRAQSITNFENNLFGATNAAALNIASGSVQ